MSKNTEYWRRLNRRSARNERAWQQEIGELERQGRKEAEAYRRNLDEQALRMRLKMLDQPAPRRPHNTQQDGVHPAIVAIVVVVGLVVVMGALVLMTG